MLGLQMSYSQRFMTSYDELRRLAASRLSRESPGQTLQATALVHEAYLRLIGNPARNWANRRHFFAAAAEAMRRILVENARRKKNIRSGGDRKRVRLHETELTFEGPPDDLIALDVALTKLADEDYAKYEMVKLRYFAGLTLDEAAKAIGISMTTAKRRWKYARAWLYREIRKGQ